jgi:exopolysaccharide production protein ExoZ
MVTENHKLGSLEAGRGIAAFLVVLAHVNLDFEYFHNHKIFNGFFVFGHAGVDFFFVLSGFIIFFIHSKDIAKPEQTWNFIFKRISRIYPTYWIVTIILIVSYIFLPNLSADGSNFSISRIIKSLFLLPIDNAFPNTGSKPILQVGWTLVFEMTFYLIFATLIVNKIIGKALFVSWAAFLILQITYDVIPATTTYPLQYLLSTHNLEFILGILVGIFVQNFLKSSHKFLLLPGVFIFLLVGASESMLPALFSGDSFTLLYGFSSGLIIIGCSALEKFLNFKTPSLLVHFGAASYSIYLIHVPLLSILNRVASYFSFTNFLNPHLVFFMLVFICMISGSLFYKIIDKPVQNYLGGK